MILRPLVEARVQDVVRRIRGGEHPEDDLIDCKYGLPEGHAAARRIGAQLNASYGEPVLWIEGIDAKSGITKAVRDDLQEWWGQVEPCFEPPAPALNSLLIAIEDFRLRALQFSPTALPCLVRNANRTCGLSGSAARAVFE
jgi:hypothetical protein